MRRHPQYGLAMPTTCPGVPDAVLDPKATWVDGSAYDAAARAVALRFERNFVGFESDVSDEVKAAGIRVQSA
jgi:phosphoenolpyruvate carboxykinase (ATP)